MIDVDGAVATSVFVDIGLDLYVWSLDFGLISWWEPLRRVAA